MKKPPSSDVFYEKYTPFKNHLDDNADYDGCMYETYDEQLAYIEELAGDLDPAIHRRVWTILEAEGNTYFSAGYHHVNRLGYLVTEESWEDENEEYIDWNEDDRDDKEFIDNDDYEEEAFYREQGLIE